MLTYIEGFQKIRAEHRFLENDKFDIGDLAATTLGGITVSVTINLIKNDRNNKKIRKRRLELVTGKNNSRRKMAYLDENFHLVDENGLSRWFLPA